MCGAAFVPVAAISNLPVGLVVPIPTFPVSLSKVILSFVVVCEPDFILNVLIKRS